jgi:hypothetical protein
MRWNGSTWTLVSPQPPFQGTIRGSGPSDIWIFKSAAKLAHYDGTTWTDLSIDPSIGANAWSSWASGTNEAWMAVAMPLPVGPDLIQRTQPGLYHLTNGAWQRVASPLDSLTDVFLGAMWGSGPNDVWTGGDAVGPTISGHTLLSAALLHWDGNAWQSVSSAALQKDGQIIQDLWGTSPHDVWAAGGGASAGLGELWHYDGSDWTETVFANPAKGYFGTLWGSCPSDFWVYGPVPGGNKLWHYDGTGWSVASQPISTYAFGAVLSVQPAGRMTGTSPDDVWVTGSSGRTCFRNSAPFVLHLQQSQCGDGTVGPGEECDPPRRGPDGLQCDSTCHLLTCGNGVVDPGEDCDPPTTGRCDTSCHSSICGNGVVDPGEDCEPPRTSTCDASCHSIPVVCGNGIQQPGETCDFPDGALCQSCNITCCGSCFNNQVSFSSICRASDGTACTLSCQHAGEVCSSLSGTDRTACQALANCMLTNMSHCASGSTGTLGCYCSDQTCSAGANGPCAAQLQAVAKTTDTTEIKRQLADFTTTVGGVAVEVVGFGSSSCGQACANGVSVCGFP